MSRASVVPVAVLVAATALLAGCTADAPESDAASGAAVPAPAVSVPGAGDGAVVIVLPPSDGLAEPERRRVRTLVERAARAGVAAGAWQVLEPATAAALADTLALAVRRAGADGTVCLVGARGRTPLVPLLVRYPATRVCLVPGPLPQGAEERSATVGDVDLQRLGEEVGAAARAAAGDGAVLLLDGGDAMLDVRWRRGVEQSILGAAGAVGPALGVVATAAEAVTLLDEQAALIADGIVPGASGPAAPGADEADGPATGDTLPSDGRMPDARALRRVAVVILDAGPEAARLAPVLAERGIRVVTPTSLLRAGDVAPTDVVLHWSVRWDAALAAALARPAADGTDGADGATPSPVDALVLQPGSSAAG